MFKSRLLVAVWLMAAVTGIPVLAAQTPSRAAFEVASVKSNHSGSGTTTRQNLPGGRVTATNITVQMLLQGAYAIQDFQITGGPPWVATDRFDVVAKAAVDLGKALPDPGQGPTMLQLMMRTLLADRFKLKLHHETRDLPIYALVLARGDKKLGPKITATNVDCAALAAARGRADAPASAATLLPGGAPQCGTIVGPGSLSAGGVPLSQLASILSRLTQGTVLDKTGLSGFFDVELRFTEQMLWGGALVLAAPTTDPSDASIFTAIQEQLGLKLESTRGPVDVLVIDHVEHPTED